MQTKWYLILVLTTVLAASVISISFADEDVSAQDQSIAPAGKPAPVACYPPCLEDEICKKGVCEKENKWCDDGNECTIGDTLVKGKCQGTPEDDGTFCADDTGECCDGQCTDLNNPNNCFVCGNKCEGAEICDASNGNPGDLDSCVDCTTSGEVACTVTGETGNVYQTCIDTSSDTENCGACGSPCEEGTECCSGICTDTSTDEANCGACGSPCEEGTECCSGTCTDILTDEANCGACGNACGGTESCDNGGCASACLADEASCNPDDDKCCDTANCARDAPTNVDLCCPTEQWMGQFVGGADKCCPRGDPHTVACQDPSGNVVCVIGTECPDPWPTPCESWEQYCGGACTDTSTDEANCGACGTTCVEGTTECVGGVCKLVNYQSCQTNDQCASGLCGLDNVNGGYKCYPSSECCDYGMLEIRCCQGMTYCGPMGMSCG